MTRVPWRAERLRELRGREVLAARVKSVRALGLMDEAVPGREEVPARPGQTIIAYFKGYL